MLSYIKKLDIFETVLVSEEKAHKWESILEKNDSKFKESTTFICDSPSYFSLRQIACDCTHYSTCLPRCGR